MGGIQTGGIGSQTNVSDLKNVIKKTTKVTKVSRGETGEAGEDPERIGEVDIDHDDDDEEEDEGSLDPVMDTDGN